MKKHRHTWKRWGEYEHPQECSVTVSFSMCACGACMRAVSDEHVTDRKVREADGSYREMPTVYARY